MNGFTASDMTTAAANRFRDGLAAQPAAAQEAVYRAPWTGTPGRIDKSGVEWRSVVGFEQFYEVSSEGRIFSLRHNRLLSNNSIASHGYIKAFFHGDGKRCQTFAHRAVAEAFLGPAEGREVNHLNGIRTDNRVENLDWVTRSENEIHSRYILGNLCEAVIAVSLRTGARVIFRSQAEAEAELCLPRDAVRRCLVGDFKSSMGWRFEKPSDSLAPVAAAPVCPGCSSPLLYECIACSVSNYPNTSDSPVDTWFADQLTAMGEVIPLASTPAAPGIDLEQFKDLIGFAAWSAINLPEIDPRRDFIRQASELLALIDASPKGGSGEPKIWGTQIPGSMPKLFGARHIAELNWYPDEGYDLVCMQVIERVQANSHGAGVSGE